MDAASVRLYQSGDHQGMVRHYQDSGFSTANNPEESLLYAASLFNCGQFSLCVDICSSLFPSHSTDIDFIALYGACLRRLGRLEESKLIFETAPKKIKINASFSNNYANLLIDLGELDKARSILSGILVDEPDYKDASLNLQRVNALLENSDSSVISHPLTRDDLDPVLNAFNAEEVSKAGGMLGRAERYSEADDLETLLPERMQAMETSELLSLAEKIAPTKPKISLSYLNYIHKINGPSVELYSCASTIYISARLFADAEWCLHSAILMGSTLLRDYLNLATLVHMRGDITLSRFLLQKADALHGGNEDIGRIKERLNSNPAVEGLEVFQYNLSQAVPGSFLDP
jgi:tetratricopeptide (TPR) repeat protein